MNQETGLSDVQRICAAHQIAIGDLRTVTGSFGKQIFFINREFLLRVSQAPMTAEQEKFRRIAALPRVPQILQTGVLERETGPLYYTLLTLLPGDDFVNVYPQTSAAQQRLSGELVARFLDQLHKIKGQAYDIGLYVPALAGFMGTWREGHEAYWEQLERGWDQSRLGPAGAQAFASAFRYLRSNSAALDYQAGAVLLHNDFHPRNILLAQGQFSGVIDWECSQFGEADFDFCHLIHWCLYPPDPKIDFRPFLGGLFAASPHCAQIPQLGRRLTIYQIEHEIQQILWNAAGAESWRVPRLARWLDGGAEDLVAELTSSR